MSEQAFNVLIDKRLRILAFLTVLAGCGPSGPSLYEIQEQEKNQFASQIRLISTAELLNISCLEHSAIVEDNQNLETAIRNVKIISYRLEANAILIDRIENNTDGIDSYRVYATALICDFGG